MVREPVQLLKDTRNQRSTYFYSYYQQHPEFTLSGTLCHEWFHEQGI